MERYQTTNKS